VDVVLAGAACALGGGEGIRSMINKACESEVRTGKLEVDSLQEAPFFVERAFEQALSMVGV